MKKTFIYSDDQLRDKDFIISNLIFDHKHLLKQLLKDRTTGKNIIFATNSYLRQYPTLTFYKPEDEITVETIVQLKKELITPASMKNSSFVEKRTKDYGEVRTPAWICNAQNNLIDEAWFGFPDTFNIQNGQTWETTKKIPFDKNRKWQNYVKDIRLEVTCGEAPYIVSRYDASSGELINDLSQRIGLLDRKIRSINQSLIKTNENTWFRWVCTAFRSIYGYEFQGDNVLLARLNLLYTFIEYYFDRFEVCPTYAQIERIIDIITWNIWQMDGLTNCVPYTKRLRKEVLEEEKDQLRLFETEEIWDPKSKPIYSKIIDWTKGAKSKHRIEYRSLLEKRGE